jgi:lipoprotein NlpI
MSIDLGTYLSLFLGQRQDAITAAREIHEHPERLAPTRKVWRRRHVEYWAGLLSEDELLDAAKGSNGNLCEAHFSIALMRLAEGERKAAYEHFRQCLATRVFYFFEYIWSRAFLTRMEKDPTWPPWIPMKP